ncbi:hypothetical protein FACS189483_04430 [Spirochaetia bacterium]|nr:hypothetical protein FACS189483_04430 [Spirochaetia bacterium]
MKKIIIILAMMTALVAGVSAQTYDMQVGPLSNSDSSYWDNHTNLTATDLFNVIKDVDCGSAEDYETYYDLTQSAARRILQSLNFSSTDIDYIMSTVIKTGAYLYRYTNDAGYYWYVYIEKN